MRINRAIRIIINAFLAETVILFLIVSLIAISLESTIILLIFDFLFISFIFQLNGTAIRKLVHLAAGNALGLLCNYLLVQLGMVGGKYFGKAFDVFYGISYPVVNTLWMVTFWSLSLSNLPKPTDSKFEASN